MKNQLIVVNKPKNFTSRDVVNKLTKILHTKKIGHTGTLDPLASGVLVVLVGKYTKLNSILTGLDKEYIATIKLGIKTDTLDITGQVLETRIVPILDKDEVKEVLNSFKGVFKETVPIYSAVHVNGKRLYEYARNNEEVELPEREVVIKEIELLNYHDDIIEFKCLVSKGTYIRSLIAKICEKLNTIGVMSELIRTKQGKFTLENSYTLPEIMNNNYKGITIRDILEVKIIDKIDSTLYKKIINGNKLELNEDGYVLFKKDNRELALYYFTNNIGYLKILLEI